VAVGDRPADRAVRDQGPVGQAVGATLKADREVDDGGAREDCWTPPIRRSSARG
jgi:hypothetical protein